MKRNKSVKRSLAILMAVSLLVCQDSMSYAAEPLTLSDETAVSDETPSVSAELSEESQENSGFPGLPEGYSLSDEEVQDKEKLQSYIEEIAALEEGVDYGTNEILVNAATEELAEVYAKAFGGSLKEWYGGIALIALSAESVEKETCVADAVIASADTANRLPAAWPNYRYQVSGEAAVGTEISSEDLNKESETAPQIEGEISGYNDPDLTGQWHHEVLDTELAWLGGYKGAGVTVALLGSGIKSGHEDFSAKTIDVGYGTEDVVDGQGTHLATLIGAIGNNGIGGCGIAPEVNLLSIKIVDSDGSGYEFNLNKAIAQAQEAGADIICIDYAVPYYSQNTEKEIQQAHENGVLVVCAGGNGSSTGKNKFYPAEYAGAVGVAALNHNNTKAHFSNSGSSIRYSAPGVDIVSDGYEKSGTGQAAAIVAAQAALILSSGKVEGSGSERVDNLLAMMDKSCKRASGSGLGNGIVSLSKVLDLGTTTAKPSNPVFSHKAGTYHEEILRVSIAAQPGCTIYYSLDGKNITYKNGKLSSNAIEYWEDGTIPLTDRTTTIKAIAINDASGLVSGMTTVKYTLIPVAEYIKIGMSSNFIARGKKAKLSISARPLNADASVKWQVIGNPKGISVKNNVLTVSSSAKTGYYELHAIAKNAEGKYEGVSDLVSFRVVEPDNLITSITAQPSANITLNVGETKTVSVKIKKKDGSISTSDPNFFWSEWGAGEIIDAQESGEAAMVITGLAAGKARLFGTTLDGSGKTVTVNITVKQPAEMIEIEGSEKMTAGKSVTLKANVSPADTSNKKVRWSMVTKDKNVSVNASTGKVTAKSKAEGVYTVRATAADGSGVYKDYNITVTKGKIKSIKLEKKAVDIFRVTNDYGAPTSVGIKVNIEGDNKECWEAVSSNPDVAYVSGYANGSGYAGYDYMYVYATGKATGTVTITVRSTDGSNKKATCKVTVMNPPTSIRISLPAGRTTELAEGKSLKLSVVLGDDAGPLSAKTKKVEWDCGEFVKVDKNGKVTALEGVGYNSYVSVKTTDGSNLEASIGIQCVDRVKKIELAGLETNPVNLGTTYTFPLLYTAPDGSEIYGDIPISVSVNKPGLTAYYVPNNGYVVIEPEEKGTYKITISLKDGNTAKKTYTVKVK